MIMITFVYFIENSFNFKWGINCFNVCGKGVVMRLQACLLFIVNEPKLIKLWTLDRVYRKVINA